jgi:predicted Zn-dependent peptidase
LRLSKKWFAPIPGKPVKKSALPVEPKQQAKRILECEKQVPFNALYKAWHCCSRIDHDFQATDLITDLLSGGKSSRLYNSLVKDQKLFSSINAYTLGETDPSLVVAEGKLYDGISYEVAEKALDHEIRLLVENKITERELNKVKQKAESTFIFGEMNHANKALNLAYFEMLGDAAQINKEVELYRNITTEKIQSAASRIFDEHNSSVIYYHAKK